MPGPTSASKDKEDPQNLNPNASAQDDEAPQDEPEVVKFSPEDEAELLAESNTHKTEANALFNSGSYTEALAKYSDATDSCPNYLDFEVAVLHSNISACHLKLQEWKDAITSATAALDKLERLDAQLTLEEDKAATDPAATQKEKANQQAKGQKEEDEDEDEAVEEEIVSAGAAKSAPAPAPAPVPAPANKDKAEPRVDPAASARATRRNDIRRIRYKALMRRARARSEAGGWSNLAGAEEDYRVLAKMDNITPSDRRIVAAQLRTLPPRVKEAKERETAEMWGKLKELGNGILKPFGLNTDNFQMTQDPNTGGYSMNFKSG